MLLPSGRTNNDSRPLQKSNNPVVFETTASSLSLNLSNKQENSFALETTYNTDIAQNTKFNEKEFSKQNSSNHIEIDTNIKNYTSSINIPLLESISIAKNIPETISYQIGNWDEIEQNLKAIQLYLKKGWTVHIGNNGRLYYCNHLLQTSGWLPSLEDWIKNEDVPYGWERAVDSKGRYYYINHLNKTSTYEAPEKVKWDENPPEPRLVVLERNPSLGFGFVAGSEKPVIVRFVTDGGPSVKKLQPGDQILAVNGEDVKDAPRDHVIQLVRACENEVSLLVCQPALTYAPGRKSTLLSAGKRAKLRSRPNRVRFAESVCVNGAPLFPASAFSLSDICVPPMANVLKVFLENGQTKSFKYDASTTVQDVVSSLLDKLCLKSGEIFSLVLEHVKSLKRNKFTLLDPEETLARIAARPGSHKLRCLFRVVFVPNVAAELAQKDLNALDYLYTQCCNDVAQERFAPELQPEVALRLATLHIHQHALDNNISPNKLNVKVIEREFGLERFVPPSLFEGMKRKELRRLLMHFLKLNAEMTGSTTKILTQLQAKLHYLDIIASLPSYGAKCFSTNQKIGVERVLLIGPRFGLSQISNARNSVPQAISPIEGITHIIVNREDDISCSVGVFMQNDRVIRFSMEDRDACEFSLVLAGYHKLLTGKVLTVIREQEPFEEDNAPSYLSQHTVVPSTWSYLELYHDCVHSINFLTPPPYHNLQENYVIKCDSNMNSSNVVNSNHSSPKMIANNISSMDLDMHSVVATELLEEAKDSGISDSSGTGSYYFEQSQICENSNYVESKNQAVLRRVQEMQIMVKNSEQYLNEQGDSIKDSNDQSTTTNDKFSFNGNFWLNGERTNIVNKSFASTLDFDSDCDSLNSSKISSTDEPPEQVTLKHSDSLTLLAESINQDLSGITQGLTSINDGLEITTPLSLISSSRPELKIRGFNQILSNLQTLGTDYSQSESDAESVLSPTNSPSSRRPSILNTNGDICQNNVYRGSFGLHSPDDNNFITNNVNLSLKEYFKEFCEITNEKKPPSNESLKKLSTLYSDNLVENDTDLIDLRAIPPPQTPDDLDSFLLLNSPPKEFDDALTKHMALPGEDGELEQFLKNVVVAPPTQKTTPSKELTPEEIMSYIIPPPPDSDPVEVTKNSFSEYVSNHKEHMESLYSNSNTLKKSFVNSMSCNEDGPQASLTRIIEYATVERQSKFSCCPKMKKEEIIVHENVSQADVCLKLPPRIQSNAKFPPARPPKSKELIQRFSPKKQLPQAGYFLSSPHSKQLHNINENPPLLPPRPSQTHSNVEVRPIVPSTVSLTPKKPLVAPIISRPMYLRSNPTQLCLLTENGSKPSSPTLPMRPPITKTSKMHSQTVNSSNFEFEIQCPQPSTSKSYYGEKCIERNGLVIDGESLLSKTDVAMAGLLIKLDEVATQCAAAQSAGGGASIDEEKFQKARNELTEQTLVLVTASKYLVVAMSDITLITLPEHLTSCLTALRNITELTKDMTRHTSSPLQTRNIVLKVHDVASHFRELVQVQIGPLGAGKLALQAECLANVLATLLRSLRVFSP